MKVVMSDDCRNRSISWNSFSLCFIIILVISLGLRLYKLDERPLHQDESVIATYSWQLFAGGGYRYHPILHGPFLFYLNTIVFFLFGVSDYTTRLGQAFVGTGLVALTCFLRGRISDAGVLAAAALLGFGPTFLYYTRFGKPDPFLVFFFVLFVILCLRYRAQGSASALYGAAASLSLLFCSKENAYLYLGVLVSFLGVLLGYRTFASNDPSGSLGRRWRELISYIQKRRREFVLGFILFCAIYVLLYSSFFTNPGGILDGLYRQSIRHWFSQHVNPGGWEAPFPYYLPLLIIYEIPVVVFGLWGLYRQLARGVASRSIFFGSLGFTCILALYLNQDFPKGLVPVAHIDKTGHFAIALCALFIGFWATFSYLKEGRTFRAFIVYWSALSVVGYSCIWVKAPWFFVHILLPQIFLAAASFGDFWETGFRVRHRILATVFILLLILPTIHNTVLLNFHNASDPRERLVTAQTSPEVLRIVTLIDGVARRLGTGYDTPMAVQDAAAWPLSWYLRNYKNWYRPGAIEERDRDKAIVIVDWNDRDRVGRWFASDYLEFRFPHRGWCIADTKDLTLKKIWRYFVYREPFNSIVFSYVTVYVRKDLWPIL